MKSTILFFFLYVVSHSFAQEKPAPSEEHFGVAVNSSLSYNLNAISFAPTGFYYCNQHQFELGVGIYPFDRSFNRIIGLEFNYKYFVKGIDNRFCSYVTARTGLSRELTNDFSTFEQGNFSPNLRDYYLSIMIGYGLQVNLSDKVYLGTNLSIGGGTFSRKHLNQSELYEGNVKMLEEFYRDVALQLNIGYRF